MKKTHLQTLVSSLLCGVLIAASALTLAGCDNTEGPVSGTEAPAGTASGTAAETVAATVVGEGATVFSFTVVDGEGKEIPFEIHTDKATVGEALLDLGLIAGEAGPYGLYVKTVNGLTVDYDTDKAYWSFYENGKYAIAGVDQTAIKPGTSYAFKVEKG